MAPCRHTHTHTLTGWGGGVMGRDISEPGQLQVTEYECVCPVEVHDIA